MMQPECKENWHRAVQSFDTLDSTNEEAKRQARQGAADGTVICAAVQTKGRGRYDRSWISPEGNLYASYIIRRNYALEKAAQLSFVSAIALRETLLMLCGGDLPENSGFKWPNDVLLSGKKIAGILLESSGTTSHSAEAEWIIMGVGVNVLHYPDAVMWPATSIRKEFSLTLEVDTVLAEYMRAFSFWQKKWENEGFAPIREKWLESALHLGQDVEVKGKADVLRGVFKTIDTDGSLILEDADSGQQQVVVAGDVFF